MISSYIFNTFSPLVHESAQDYNVTMTRTQPFKISFKFLRPLLALPEDQ